MYTQFNEQLAATSRQFADTAAQINRLALDNASQVFGLQRAALQQGATAAFAFLGEVAEVRDAEALKTNDAIGQLAKAQFETATTQAQAAAESVAKAAKAK